MKRLLLVFTLLILVACTQQPLKLTTVFSANNCGLKETTLTSIERQEQLSALLASIPRSFNQPPLALPKIDYNDKTVVLYGLGQKPTTGYTIELAGEQARLSDDTLYVPVRQKPPAKDRFYPQLITSPCSVYSLPKITFSTLAIELETGQ